MLVVAAVLSIFLAIAHSYLGEQYVFTRLFRQERELNLIRNEWFTRRVLRLAWHTTSVAWFGFGAILYALAGENEAVHKQLLWILSGVFLLSGVLSIAFTHGKHPSWFAFLSIAGISLYAAFNS